MARIEYREETCTECDWQRDRQWSIRTIAMQVEVPQGYRVEERRGGWRTVAAPTRMATMCGCDV